MQDSNILSKQTSYSLLTHCLAVHKHLTLSVCHLCANLLNLIVIIIIITELHQFSCQLVALTTGVVDDVIWSSYRTSTHHRKQVS